MELKLTFTASQGNTISGVIKKTLSGNINGPVRKIAGIVGVLPDWMINTAVSLFGKKINKAIEDALAKNGIPAEVSAEKVKKDGETLNVTLLVSQIGYQELAKRFLPSVLAAISEKTPDGFPAQAAAILGDDTEKIVSVILSEISDEKKEKLIAAAVKEYRPTVADKLTETLNERGIMLDVKEISVFSN